MRIALLSYRSKAHGGGQGVYVRQLSRGLVELGHQVEVFSGQPYPEGLDARVVLTKVPSLDLYRDDDPFRTPRPSEFRDWIDLVEYLTMVTAGFPEPLTFSLRIRRILAERAGEFDVVHDNQSLGYGLLSLISRGMPLVATIHHPISRDRAVDLAAAPRRKRFTTRRWYAFVRMQARVARRIPAIIGVSQASGADTITDFDIKPEQLTVVANGVDVDLFSPSDHRVPGRVVAVASADKPLKGIGYLLDAVAKLRPDHDIELHLVCAVEPGGPSEQRIEAHGIGDIVTIHRGVPEAQVAELLASAEVMAVPSLYEGFSLPAVEAMACGTPVVASRAGALPEVIGDAGILVEPGNVEDLATAIAELLDSSRQREHYSARGRQRALEYYSWPAVARSTLQVYERAIQARDQFGTGTEGVTHVDR